MSASQVDLEGGQSLFGMGNLIRIWDTALLSSILDLLSCFPNGRPYAVIITGNLRRGYLHSERRATCFNCTLVTSFYEHIDQN